MSAGLFGTLPTVTKAGVQAEEAAHILPTGTVVGALPVIPPGLKVFCGELLGFRELGPMRPDASVMQAYGKTWVSFTFEAGPSVWRTKGKPDPTMGEVPGSGVSFAEPAVATLDEGEAAPQ